MLLLTIQMRNAPPSKGPIFEILKAENALASVRTKKDQAQQDLEKKTAEAAAAATRLKQALAGLEVSTHVRARYCVQLFV